MRGLRVPCHRYKRTGFCGNFEFSALYSTMSTIQHQYRVHLLFLPILSGVAGGGGWMKRKVHEISARACMLDRPKCGKQTLIGTKARSRLDARDRDDITTPASALLATSTRALGPPLFTTHLFLRELCTLTFPTRCPRNSLQDGSDPPERTSKSSICGTHFLCCNWPHLTNRIGSHRMSTF